MELMECKPYRLKLMAASCAAQFKMAGRADPKSPFIHRECLGCKVGEANAEANPKADGKPSWPQVRRRREKPLSTCEQCGKRFRGHRSHQRFCPGGKCNVGFHQAKHKADDEADRGIALLEAE